MQYPEAGSSRLLNHPALVGAPYSSMIDDEIAAYYSGGKEAGRLAEGPGLLEFARTQELLQRFLPKPPATVVDVGGGPGIYAAWLSGLGYHVHLVDPVPLHVEQARAAALSQQLSFTASLGDARNLPVDGATQDAVLLMGPLYHLVAREERLLALQEAQRVLKPGGVVIGTAISRFAKLFDWLRLGFLGNPGFEIPPQDLEDGRHFNPDRRPRLFSTAYFHRPAELAQEFQSAGLSVDALLGIEGPAWLMTDIVSREDQLEPALHAARLVEDEASLLGLSSHLMAVGRPA